MYDIIGTPFGYVMKLIYDICGNYAVSIIIFTLLTKILLLPVNYKTQKNAARMRLLNPKLEKLKKSFGSNPQRLQEEQNKLYQQEGINPMGSCLPMFIQMVILFGILDVVYKPIKHILHISKDVVNIAVERAAKLAVDAGLKDFGVKDLRCELKTMEQVTLHPEKFKDLAENFRDLVYHFNEHFTLFGANLGKTPSLHPEVWDKEAVVLFLIPIISGIVQLASSLYSSWYSKKTNPTMSGQGCMTGMMIGLPIWSVWLAFSFPAGIGFYWIWSSLFSFIITFVLNNYFTDEKIAEIAEKDKEKARLYAEKHPGKKSFMEKLMEQAAAEQAAQGRIDENGEKISRSEQNRQDRDKLKEARKRMAEKYGDSYSDGDSD